MGNSTGKILGIIGIILPLLTFLWFAGVGFFYDFSWYFPIGGIVLGIIAYYQDEKKLGITAIIIGVVILIFWIMLPFILLWGFFSAFVY